MRPRTRRPAGPILAAASLVLVVLLGACGSLGSGPTEAVDPDDGIDVSEVLDDVDYYGACGNEVLTLDDGRRLYPLPEEEVERLDERSMPPRASASDAAEGAEGAGSAGSTTSAAQAAVWPQVLPRVMPPGPGDDVGTLVVYDDGYARFESDSGRVRWLTTAEREYGFVC